MKRTPIISGEGILNLIPQRPPIVMVDSFCGIEENCSYSGLTVTDDNIFCQEGKLQEAGLVEHIAPVPAFNASGRTVDILTAVMGLSLINI